MKCPGGEKVSYLCGISPEAMDDVIFVCAARLQSLIVYIDLHGSCGM